MVGADKSTELWRHPIAQSVITRCNTCRLGHLSTKKVFASVYKRPFYAAKTSWRGMSSSEDHSKIMALQAGPKRLKSGWKHGIAI